MLVSRGVLVVSARICALKVTHSSQMKTHSDNAGLRHPPSMRRRTSCCDLPQNEQNTDHARQRGTSGISLVHVGAANLNAHNECVKTFIHSGRRRGRWIAGALAAFYGTMWLDPDRP